MAEDGFAVCRDGQGRRDGAVRLGTAHDADPHVFFAVRVHVGLAVQHQVALTHADLLQRIIGARISPAHADLAGRVGHGIAGHFACGQGADLVQGRVSRCVGLRDGTSLHQRGILGHGVDGFQLGGQRNGSVPIVGNFDGRFIGMNAAGHQKVGMERLLHPLAVVAGGGHQPAVAVHIVIDVFQPGNGIAGAVGGKQAVHAVPGILAVHQDLLNDLAALPDGDAEAGNGQVALVFHGEEQARAFTGGHAGIAGSHAGKLGGDLQLELKADQPAAVHGGFVQRLGLFQIGGVIAGAVRQQVNAGRVVGQLHQRKGRTHGIGLPVEAHTLDAVAFFLLGVVRVGSDALRPVQIMNAVPGAVVHMGGLETLGVQAHVVIPHSKFLVSLTGRAHQPVALRAVLRKAFLQVEDELPRIVHGIFHHVFHEDHVVVQSPLGLVQVDGKLLLFVQPVIAGKTGIGAIGAGDIIAVEGGVGGSGGGHPAHALHVFNAVGRGVVGDVIGGRGLVQIHGMDGGDLAALDVLPGAGRVQEPDGLSISSGAVVPDKVHDRGGQIPRGVRRFRYMRRVFFHRQRAVLKLQHRQRHGALGRVILSLGEHAAEDVHRHHILMASDGEGVIGRGARRASLGVAAHGGINFAVPRGVVQIVPDQLGLTARCLARGGDPQAEGGLFGAGLQGNVLYLLRQRVRLLEQLLLRRGEYAGFSRASRGKLLLFGNVDPGGKGGERNSAVFRSVRRVQGVRAVGGGAPRALPEGLFQLGQDQLRRDLQPEAHGNGRAAALAQPQKRLDVAVKTDGEAEKVLYAHAGADAQLRQNGDGHAGAEVQRHIGHAGPVGGKADAERRAQREGEVHRAEAGNGPDHEGIGIAALEGHLHAGVALQTDFFLQTLCGHHLGDATLQGGEGRKRGLDIAEEFGGLAGALILVHLIVDRIGVPLALPGCLIHAVGLVLQAFPFPAQLLAFEGLAVGVLDVSAGVDDHLGFDKRQTQIHLQVADEGRVSRKLEAKPAGREADELIVIEHRLFHVGFFDLQLGLEGPVIALGGDLRPDGHGGAGGDQAAVFVREGDNFAGGELARFFRRFQISVFIVGLVDQIQGARQHLLVRVFQNHVDGLLGVVFGSVIDGVLLHHDVAAVIAGHAQVGNAGILLQPDDLRLSAP